MAVLINSYAPAEFNKIPKLSAALENFNKHEAKLSIKSLLNVFLKHGVEREFGLAVVHRHFELELNEILVEAMTQDKTLSIASSWKLDADNGKPSDLEYWSSFDIPSHKFLLPQTWTFTPNGTLKPFEFLCADEILSEPSDCFIKELYCELKSLGLNEILGLRRIHLVVDTSTWETTPENVRANVTQIGDRPFGIQDGEMVPVVWKANREEQNWCLVCWCHRHGACEHKGE